MAYISLYCLVLNIFSFLVFGVDKRRAKRNVWRISERTLFLPAVIGGSAGALLGMLVFHHKTHKTRFVIGIPLLLLIQASAAAMVLSGEI